MKNLIKSLINWWRKKKRKEKKDNVKLRSRPTEHDVVLRVSMQISLIEVSREDFHVAAPTIDLLLVFHSELDHQAFALVAERLEPCRRSIEAGILAGLQTLTNQKYI